MTTALLFLPELVCLLGALLVFALAMLDKPYATVWRGAVVMSVLTAAASLIAFNATGDPFGPRMVHMDLFSQLSKLGLAFGLLAVVLLSARTPTLSAWNRREMPMFLFCSTFGMMLLVSATELLTFYVALEFSAYPLYILVALHRHPRFNMEGAAKYFLQGAVSSAFTLYGLSLLFGAAHTTFLADLGARLPELLTQPMFMLGLLLTMGGVLYKLAVFPFHFWAPDVYAVGSNPAITFIATSSKLAAIAVLCRFTGLVDATPGRLAQVFFALSVVSMTLGNLAAIRQHDMKRMLAYSAIAHGGYALVGLCSFNAIGLAAALFYGFSYLVMSLLCFLVVCVVSAEEDSLGISAMAGLYQRAPLMALALLTGLLGLAGVPPTAGFVGKWILFTAALSQGHLTLVLIAAVNSTIALYYYLRVLRCAYLDPPTTDQPIAVSGGMKAFAVALIILIALLGIIPGPLWGKLTEAVTAL